jgi:hypothetical protein
LISQRLFGSVHLGRAGGASFRTDLQQVSTGVLMDIETLDKELRALSSAGIVVFPMPASAGYDGKLDPVSYSVLFTDKPSDLDCDAISRDLKARFGHLVAQCVRNRDGQQFPRR